MAYTYWLPDNEGNKRDYQTEMNSVIIIGANGSGKSKMGAWIEQQEFAKVHRIGAQRSLNFKENISLKSFSSAENNVLYGTDDPNYIERVDKNHRWEWGKYTTRLLDDYEDVLAALIAKDNNEKRDYYQKCKLAQQNGEEKPVVENSTFDKLVSIWNAVLPHRTLLLEDSKFYACNSIAGNITETEEEDNEVDIDAVVNAVDDENGLYSATEMSDGERSVLYLASQVLCIPDNKILIIDEPELHMHRSIMNKLWSELEKCREDCLFIYITHDTHFVAGHRDSSKIWVKAFADSKWDWAFVNDELPEELMFNLIGARKDILFVEGNNESFDISVYSELFPDYYVVPCGSCSEVISRTKAYGNSAALHEYSVTGLIDRDYRPEYELNALKEDGIYTLNVAEVENLFVVEEVVRFMANHLGGNADEIFTAIKEYVINERFSNQINRQICNSIVASVKYALSSIDIQSRII